MAAKFATSKSSRRGERYYGETEEVREIQGELLTVWLRRMRG